MRWFNNLPKAGKIGVIAGAAVLFLLLLAWILVPVIAAAKAPGIIERAFADQFNGSVKAGKVSIGWGAPITIEGLEILDDKGQKVGTVNASIPIGIWGALRGSTDYRTIRAKVSLAIVDSVDAKGGRSSNLARALAPKAPKPKSGEPASLPSGYTIAFELEPSDISYIEVGPDGKTLSTASITNLTASGEFDTASPAGSLKALLKAAVSATAAGQTGAGSLDLALSITDLTDAKGVVQSDKAVVDAKLTAKNAPIRLADALFGLDGALAGALGDTADATLTAKGNSAKADSAALLSSPNTTADVAFRIEGGRMTAAKTGSVKMASTAFLTRLPALRDFMARSGVTLDQAPSLDIAINSLVMPTDPAADLRGASMDITLNAGAARATAPGDGPNAPPRRLAFTPGVARITTPDIASGLAITGNTSATIDGRSAGAITVQLDLKQVLDARGAWRKGLPGSLAGSVAAKGVAAELLNPILAGMDLPVDSRTDIGDTLDITLTARDAGARGDDAAASVPTDIDLLVQSANIRLDSFWRLSNTRLETRDAGVTARINATTPLANRFLSRGGNPPMTLSGQGPLTISSQRLFFPLTDGKPSGQAPEGDFQFAWSGASLTPTQPVGGAAPRPIMVETLGATLTMAPKTAPRITLNGKLTHDAKPMTVTGNLTLDGLFEGARPKVLPGIGSTRITGSLALKDLPAALVGALGLGDSDLFAGVAGDRVNVDLEFAGVDASQGLTFKAVSTVLAAEAAATIADRLDVGKVTAVSTMKADSARSLLLAFGLDEASLRDLRLPASSRIDMSVKPFSLPIAAGSLKPDFDRITSEAVEADARIDQPLTVENLKVGENTISGGVTNLSASAKVPLASLGPKKASSAPITAVVNGLVVRTNQGRVESVATLKADVSYIPDGPLNADVSLRDIRSAMADEMLGRPGYVSGALGETAAITLKAARPPGVATTSVVFDLDSRLLSARNWKVESADGVIRVVGPATADWKMEPEWANRYLFTPPADSRRSALVNVIGATPIAVRIDRLAFSMPKDGVGGPFKPGVFAVQASIAVPRIAAEWREWERPDEGADGKFNPGALLGALSKGRPPGAPREVKRTVVIEDSRFALTSQPDGSIAIEIMARKSSNEVADVPGNVEGRLVLSNLGDSSGQISDNAVLNGSLEVHSFPTAILDGLAQQRGVLRDGLGPSMDLNARFGNAGMNSGTVRGTMDSRRAVIAFDARMANHTLVMTPGPVNPNGVTQPACKAELLEISESLGRKLMRPMFTISSVYKTREDGPGLATSNELVMPLDNDMRKLNGLVHIDLGTARFQTNNDLFSGLIKALGGQASGTIGRRMTPFDVQISNGVARFKDVKVPLGEFTCESSGSIDLVNETVDVLIWIPALMVTDEALGALNLGIGSMFRKIVPADVTGDMYVPFRVRGPIASPGKPAPDGKLFAERFGNSLLKSPEKVLDGLGLPNPFKKK